MNCGAGRWELGVTAGTGKEWKSKNGDWGSGRLAAMGSRHASNN